MRKLVLIDNPSNQRNVFCEKVAILRTPSPLDGFTADVIDMPDGRKSVAFTSDIRTLLNQNRIAHLNPQFLNEILQRMRSSSVDTSNLPDDVLIDGIKSRYIQSNADMYNYMRWIEENLDSTVSDIKAQAEALKSSQQQASDDSGPSDAE